MSPGKRGLRDFLADAAQAEEPQQAYPSKRSLRFA